MSQAKLFLPFIWQIWIYIFFTCNFQLLFRCNRNVMKFVCLYAADAFLPFLDEGKEQRMVAANCVFPRNAMLSTPPSFLICVLLSGGWWIFLRLGCGTLAQQTISQTILHNKSNRQADLNPAPLPSVLLPKFSSQMDIGVDIVQS